jgi:hypothetical protein
METNVEIEGIIYTLAAFRTRQGWLGEWRNDSRGHGGVIAAQSVSAEEAIELAREAAWAAVGRKQELAAH